MTADNIEFNFNREVHRGELWYMSYGQAVGSEMQKARPVVIVSNETCNEFSPVVTVLPITSKDKKPLPTHVQIPATQELVHGIIMAEQIMTTSKMRLMNYVGEVDEETLQEIDKAICIQCAIEREQVQKVSANNDSIVDKLRNELLTTQNKLEFAEQEVSNNIVVIKDLQEQLAKMTERAKIFEELYKEEVKNE